MSSNTIKPKHNVLFVINDKGGVAKDLTAEGLKIALIRAEADHQLIEIESQKRLGLLYPDSIFIEAKSVAANEVYADPDVVFRAMDQLAIELKRKATSIVCVGANLTGAFLAWSLTNGSRTFGEGEDFHFICPLTMNKSALSAGLGNLYDVGVQYPRARRTAILNEFAAPFIDGDRFLTKRLAEAQSKGAPIGTIKLRRMAAPAWGYLQNLGPLAEVAKMPAQKLIDLGLPEGPSVRSMVLFEEWLENDLVGPLSNLIPKSEV